MEENNNVESTLSESKQLLYNAAVVKTLSVAKDASNIGSEKMKQHIKQKKYSNERAERATKGNILGKSTSRLSSKPETARTSTRTGNILGEKYQSPIKKASNKNILVSNSKSKKGVTATKIKEHIFRHQKINHILMSKNKATFGKKGIDKVVSFVGRMIQLAIKEVGKVFLLSAAACLPFFICFISVVLVVTLAVGVAGYSSPDTESYIERENSISFADCIAYNQGDPKWKNLPLGKSSTVGSAGCCLTCIATCIASWGHPEVTPATVWQYARTLNGYDNTALGQNVIRSMIPKYGLQLETITNVKNNFDQIEIALSEGKYVIVFVDGNNPGYFCDAETGAKTKKFTNRTHFFVLIGRQNGYIVCMDPNGGVIRYTSSEQLLTAYHKDEAFVVWNAAMLPEGEPETEE